MSKKLLSLVLAIAMVMSIFAIGFSTVAAAEDEVPTLTYYFLAPSDWGDQMATYAATGSWNDGGVKWPGAAMVAEPTVGKNVWSITTSVSNTWLIFNNNNNGKQTENVDVSPETTGQRNVANRIYVLDLTAEKVVGEWFSLDPTAEDYYRKSSNYGTYGLDNDPEQTAVITEDQSYKAGWNPYPRGEKIDLSTAEMKETTFTFEASNGFEDMAGMIFYVWDESTEPAGHFYLDDQTWWTSNNWGMYQENVVDKYGEDVIDQETGKPETKLVNGVKNAPVGDDNRDIYKATLTLPVGHATNLIVQAYHKTKDCPQTCNIVITPDADGDTLIITGGQLENPVDSSQFTIEAKFKNTDKCGPAKVLTSTCKVVGVVVQGDPAKEIAEKVHQYYVVPKTATEDQPDDPNWTYENVQKAIADFGVAAEDVMAAYETAFPNDTGAIKELAEEVILPKNQPNTDTDNSNTDTDNSNTDTDNSNTDTDKTNTDDQGKKNTDDQGKKNTDDQGKKNTDDQGGKNTDDQGKKNTDDQGKKNTDDQGKKNTDDQGGKDDKNTDDQGGKDDKNTDDQGGKDDKNPDKPGPGDDKTDTDPDKPGPGGDGKKTKKVKLGDVNQDGAIDSLDALLILRHSLDLEKVDVIALGDIDGDGTLDATDALAVLRWSLELKDDANANVGTEIEIPA